MNACRIGAIQEWAKELAVLTGWQAIVFLIKLKELVL
jgi:hypothetical protein